MHGRGRLVLEPATNADLEPMFALHTDPRVWTHLPSGRHTSLDQTAKMLARNEQCWQSDGLGYWALRLRADDAQAVVGIGGCARNDAGVWNLYYRLAPECHGRGLASEVAAAGLAAAGEVDGSRPVVAFLLERNAASRRTAERVGLTLAWRGPDREHPDLVRLVFGDRPLSQEQLDAVIAL